MLSLIRNVATDALIQHEQTQPERLRDLVGEIARQGITVPIAVASTAHGFFVLDGAHRSAAARMLDLSTVSCRVFDMAQRPEIAGWTHVVSSAVAQQALRIHAAQSVGNTGRVVATLRRRGRSAHIRATTDTDRAIWEAFHAVARRYAWSGYRRAVDPSLTTQCEVTWRIPAWPTLTSMVAESGPLPAGVSQFALSTSAQVVPPPVPVRETS